MFTKSILIAGLVGFAAAGPVEVRQIGGRTGTTANEFSQGGCRDILFAWARGSTEIGNMVRISISSPQNILTQIGNCRRSPDFRWFEAELRRQRRRNRRYRLRRCSCSKQPTRRHRYGFKEPTQRYSPNHGNAVSRLRHC